MKDGEGIGDGTHEENGFMRSFTTAVLNEKLNRKTVTERSRFFY